jgi:hypothetical protein
VTAQAPVRCPRCEGIDQPGAAHVRGCANTPVADMTVGELHTAVSMELKPIYYVTPGGLKWSRSTDALRELVIRAKEPLR